MSDKEIKHGDSVKVTSTGKYGIVADYQRVHNRYQLRDVSGWQYGIGDIEKQSYESLHEAIDSQSKQLELALKALEEIGENMGDIYEFPELARSALSSIQSLGGTTT